jgi:hypothetical protein
MDPTLSFCSVIFPAPQAETNALLLAESLRAFAGSLAAAPLNFYLPEYGRALSAPVRRRLAKLDVTLVPFPLDPHRLDFFFAAQLTALGLAEEHNAGSSSLLAWLDANTLVLHEPHELELPPGKFLGYRPVHHLLLGSRYDSPPDPFWTLIYQTCQVPPERIFPMRPVVEDLQMRPYFNAGLLVTRPEAGLWQAWSKRFFDLYQTPAFQAFYQQDPRYTIFMHQAVLSGVILHHLTQDQLLELPETYNYPAHLFDQDGTSRRPSALDDLTTFRHEGFYTDPAWTENLPASPQLKSWLSAHLPG